MSGILQNIQSAVNKNICLKFGLMMFISGNLLAATNQPPLEAAEVEMIIQQARELQLADKPAWLNLLHYKKNIFASQQSQADDNAFFLSESGSEDPQAELETDIRAYFTHQTATQASSQHAQCRFPARLHWLNKQLNFQHQLPAIQCMAFDDWKADFNARQITLLFPGIHLNNPASMFGHTFIRFDETGKNHLLSQTLSYAAEHDETDSMLVYSWKGISGGYNGRFFIQPYYERLREYSDIEQRDIWEYTLNLNQQEIDQLVRHLWEIRQIEFKYYFLRENCSFRLLSLFDVARENINMSLDSHPLYAVPVDTVRDVERAGLIAEKFYRPSAHNKISQMMQQVGPEVGEAALSITDKEQSIEEIFSGFSVKQQAQSLQLADEILNQQENLTEEERALQLKLLSQRSRLDISAEALAFEFSSIPPESSHQSARWQLSAGEFDQAKFYEIGIRPTFHDVLDDTRGFIKGAEVSVLDARFRWYETEQNLKLETLTLFSMRSIIASKPWVTPLSRQLSFKIKQRELNQSQQVTEFESQFSSGFAVDVHSALTYLMIKSRLDYATELKNNHAFYAGLETGLIWDFQSNLLSGQAEINYQALLQVSGEEGDIQQARVAVQFNIVQDHALRVEYEEIRYERFDVKQGMLSYLIYF